MGDRRETMEENQRFRKDLKKIAIPVTLQCLLQSSFGVMDQMMTGQLGSLSVAGIGMGNKFMSLYTVLIGAIATTAGILIAQYAGKENWKEVGRSFYTSFLFACGLALFFTGISLFCPIQVMHLYSTEAKTIQIAGEYLKIFGLTCPFAAFSTLFAAYLRCVGGASLPLYTSFFAAILNTGFNYALIFGKFGCPALGVKGAALASLLAQFIGSLLLLILYLAEKKKKNWKLPCSFLSGKKSWFSYGAVFMPIFFCEFFWALGENVYAVIYGHIGTKAYAAMTLTNPVQGLLIGAMTGISQAAGIMVGKSLGAGKFEKAYQESKKLMVWGVFGSIVLSLCLLFLAPYYVLIFQVEESVKETTKILLSIFALYLPVKVSNMVLGGGIVRSGGKTKYIMMVDLIGTWMFGVPLGLMAAFWWKLPIPMVYLILSLEEGVRLAITGVIFRKRIWMQEIT